MPEGKPAVKEIIDEHLHREGFSPLWLDIEVADRAAAGGARTIEGGAVAGVGGGFLDLKDGGRVPLHRVRRVRSRGETVYERPGPR